MAGERNNRDEPVRVFIAATPAEWLPARVLEFSIRETTDLDVEVMRIYESGLSIPQPGSEHNRPRTPFSFQRFLIPEICAHKGRAVYLDSDMLVFQDIAALWNQPLAGHAIQTVAPGAVGRRGQFSVMLLDCARLDWQIERIVADLDAGAYRYEELMGEMCVADSIGYDIPSQWNALERFDPRGTCLLHYTDMNTQPWVDTSNPLAYLWVRRLRRALEQGFITAEELGSQVSRGHVRPSLEAQIASGIDDSLRLPRAMRRPDRDFVAPYRRLLRAHARPWTSLRFAGMALLKRWYYRSFLSRLSRS